MAGVDAGVSEIRRYQYERPVPRVLKVEGYPRILDRNVVLRPYRAELVQRPTRGTHVLYLLHYSSNSYYIALSGACAVLFRTIELNSN